MNNYLEFIKEYPLVQKSKNHLVIAYPFTFDTETSHTPLNINKTEYTDEYFSAAVDLSPVLDKTSMNIPNYIFQDIDGAFIKRVCRRHKIDITPFGATISEVYENLSYMWGGKAINEADQCMEIFERLANKKDLAIAKIDEPITKGVDAWVYQWACCFRAGKYFSDVTSGRTARSLAELMKDIDEYLDEYSADLSQKRLEEHYSNVKARSKYTFENPSKSAIKNNKVNVSCVMYCHHLGYDYEYLYPFLCEYFDDIDEFFVREHKPLVVRLSRHVELRDSLLYFNDNLERLTNSYNVDHKKRVGLVDYDHVFFPDEKLSMDSWEYQFFDVLGLWECLMKDFEKEGYTTATAVLTSTGKIRSACKAASQADPTARQQFINCYTDGFVHYFLTQCFMGGYTHGNREYKDLLIEQDTGHRDKRSFYPSELRKKENLYQNGRFVEIEKPTIDMVINPKENTISMGLFTFTDAELKRKHDGFPFLSTSRALDGRRSELKYISDNGRAISIKGMFSLYLTDQDFLILYDQYKFKQINVDILYTAPAAPLPDWITKFIDSKFYNKTALKDVVKEKQKAHAPIDEIIDAEMDLMKEKNGFNGIYGMMVTNPCKPEIVRDENGGFTIEPVDFDIKINSYYGFYNGRFNKSSKGFLPYSWGVWCVAYSRRSLYYDIQIANAAKNPDGSGRGCGVYSDTDSLFYITTPGIESLYDDINKQCYDKAIEGGYYIEVNGKKINYDAFEAENTAHRFKFLHSKCYCLEDDDGLHVTVAGVPERRMIDIKDNKPIYIHRAEELKRIENFNDGFTFEKCGGTSAAYLHKPIHKRWYQGHLIEVTDACVIVPTTKKIKDVELISKVAQFEHYKYGRGEI